MARNVFDTSIKGIKSAWGPLSTEVVAACRGHLEDLIPSIDVSKTLRAMNFFSSSARTKAVQAHAQKIFIRPT